MSILNIGEKIHVIERRYFESDPRRHFVGEVIGIDHSVIRVKGYVWVFDGGRVQFIKRPEIRERVIVLGDRMTINVLPADIDIEKLYYQHDENRGLELKDDQDYILDISEFSFAR